MNMIKIIAIAYCVYKVVANPKPIALILVLLSLWLMVSSTEQEVSVERYKKGDIEVVEVEKIEKITRCNHTKKLQEFRVGTIFKRIIDMLGLQEKTEVKEVVVVQKQGFKEGFLEWLMYKYKNYKSWGDGVIFAGKIIQSILLTTFVFVGMVVVVKKIKDEI